MNFFYQGFYDTEVSLGGGWALVPGLCPSNGLDCPCSDQEDSRVPKVNHVETLRGWGVRKRNVRTGVPLSSPASEGCSSLKPALELPPSPEKIPELPFSPALRPPQTPLSRQENKESGGAPLEGCQAMMGSGVTR